MNAIHITQLFDQLQRQILTVQSAAITRELSGAIASQLSSVQTLVEDKNNTIAALRTTNSDTRVEIERLRRELAARAAERDHYLDLADKSVSRLTEALCSLEYYRAQTATLRQENARLAASMKDLADTIREAHKDAT